MPEGLLWLPFGLGHDVYCPRGDEPLSRPEKTSQAVRLIGVGAYVPAQVMTNADWAKYVDTSEEWITARTGIKRRHIAAEDESTADLAVKAAQSALAAAGLAAESLDEIIVATDTPEMRIPDTASFVQHRLGAREIPAYDLGGGGCYGFLQGVDIARSRVLHNRDTVLVVGVQLLLRLIDWKDRNSCVLFGDAAGAAIVGTTGPGPEILSMVSGTDGRHTGAISLPVGGTRHPFTLEAARKNLHTQVTLEGRAVFKEAVKRMTQAARDAVAKGGRTMSDVALVVPHQANLRIIEAVAEQLGVPREKLFVNLQEYGNTGSASLAVALWDAMQQKAIRPGDLVLLVAFGAGLHWGAALLQF
jgi:3-oxoacyl-[acyl-carrier-protein] synthase-3